MQPLIVFVGVFAVIVLPFFLWQPTAFFEDVILFQSGMTATPYPINGFGFSIGLIASGIIPSYTASFPFWIFQAGLGIPLLLALLQHQRSNNTLRQTLFNYTALLFVVSFFSRAFNDNYIGFIISLIFIVMLIDNPNRTEGSSIYASQPNTSVR